MALVFVTGATGLLGNNLVRELLARGHEVRALVRDAGKGRRQFDSLQGISFVTGDMENVDGFASALRGCDLLVHAAAYFRDSYKGGRHWTKLKRINVDGTRALMAAASAQGVRRIVHVSSIAVLTGPAGVEIDETMERDADGAEDYYRSKILADQEVFAHLRRNPDTHVTLVLPGWMHGPGDLGPTSAGQFTLDVLRQALPGIPPATFSFVDARDVALAIIAAAEKGRRGERYLAAGRNISAAELLKIYQRVAGMRVPRLHLPFWILRIVATINEAYARLTGRPVLLGLAALRNMENESGHTSFSSEKMQREFGLSFRPIDETLKDEISWFRQKGLLT